MFWDLPWFAQFRSHTLVSGFVWQFRWTWQCTPRSIPCMSPLWTPTPETKIRLQVAEVWNGRVKLLWTLVHCSMTLTRAYIIHAYCFVAPAIICTVYCLRSILKRTGSICTNDFIAIFNRVYNIYMYIFLYICMTLCIVIVVVPSNPPYTKHLYTAHNTSASTFSKKMFGHPWDRIIPAKTSLSLFSEFVRSKPETSTFI